MTATFDWSNLDLKNFEYFRYPTTKAPKPYFFKDIYGHIYSIRKIPDPPPSRIVDTKNRIKAIFKYFKNLLMGTKREQMKKIHIIEPEVSNKTSEKFQAKHGKYGEKLIEFLGQGPSREELIEAGVI